MISHKYRCILIHIPRTGGTSLEKWLGGRDWFRISPHTKHLLASQAKQVYAEYWDDYFKFAFVRNPWDRMVSCLHYASHFGFPDVPAEKRFSRAPQEKIELSGYKNVFGYPVTLEHDHRFHDRSDLLTEAHQSNRVYLNILDEPIDFIGRFERLREGAEFIQKTIGVKKPFRVHTQKSKRGNYDSYYDSDTRDELRQLFRDDIEEFGYEFKSSSRRSIRQLLKIA